MGKRLPKEERKESITIRLHKWMINEIEKDGKKQKVIESILLNHYKKPL